MAVKLLVYVVRTCSVPSGSITNILFLWINDQHVVCHYNDRIFVDMLPDWTFTCVDIVVSAPMEWELSAQ